MLGYRVMSLNVLEVIMFRSVRDVYVALQNSELMHLLFIVYLSDVFFLHLSFLFLVLIEFFLVGFDLGSWNVESDALPTEPPRQPTHCCFCCFCSCFVVVLLLLVLIFLFLFFLFFFLLFFFFFFALI